MKKKESLEPKKNRKSSTAKSRKEQSVPVLPLLKRPFFPDITIPLIIENTHLLEVIEKSENSSKGLLAFVYVKKTEKPLEDLKFEDLYTTGVLGKILKINPQENGSIQVLIQTRSRIALEKSPKKGSILHVGYKILEEEKKDSSSENKAYASSILSVIKELVKLNPVYKEEMQIFLGASDLSNPGKLADFAVNLVLASGEELQEVLETLSLDARLEKVLALLNKELEIASLQKSIQDKIDATMSKHQRDFFLKEQLKTIKKELGLERDDKSIEREKFETRIDEQKVPEEVKKIIEEELQKFTSLDSHSGEYSVIRNYLDWLTQLPWGKYSEDQLDLDHAQRVLDEDHFGLEDLKKRILEFISVGKLTQTMKGSIICLVGPPGVGKTSLGRSIARALNREFYRFSVGGMKDEAEIKGHRRTYIGAMPGKLIQALKTTQTMNPVILIDEIDKISASYHGDPSAALLEVLDPEQNNAFLDHYLDLRVDLSHVLFILTANTLDSIPEPLKDRAEILRLSGYIQKEKIEIAKRYLLPKHIEAMGLGKAKISLSDKITAVIIEDYAREAGVRSLENAVKKILRKIAFSIVSGTQSLSKKIVITKATLEEFLGKPRFHSDTFYKSTPPGVCTGLAWTSMGGESLYVEAVKVPAEKTAMKITGQAGEVMKESAEIAWTFLQSDLKRLAPGKKFFEKSHVHLHIPEGATPKDGPSAGVTMVTAMLSLVLNKPVKQKLAMTGELTLTGVVLPVGGIREKMIAAKRSGMETIILPQGNERDVEELSDEIKEGLNIHFAERYDDVYRIAFM